MVTSNKLLDKKLVKMAEQNSAVVPQRTLLGEVNEHITCPLCRGYYIDATTIVECLHSFCRSCIIKHLQVKSYCPVCEMMINSAKPNIKLDKALQDIVYKLVPGLFQKEMERRQQFYSSRPGPAASATPEQRGEDTERIIFSPEDVISFSLEYSDATDTDSISSKSSDSNEPQPAGNTRRFLQCPAVVNISHLKKFLSMKFDIDSTQFAIDILYKRVPLPDYYTLMDIAYIYNWKRNEPMRFFYQIIDYVAIRNRLFDINRKGSHFRDRKSSPTPTEDTNVSSPAPNLNDQGSEISSGTDSPMPEDNNGKKVNNVPNTEHNNQQQKDGSCQDKSNSNASTTKKNDEEVEKSQFLNSFELTAKANSQITKTSPVKESIQETPTTITNTAKGQVGSPKVEDSLKRKQQTPPKTPEMKRLKIELEKTKVPQNINKQLGHSSVSSPGASDSPNKLGSVFDSLLKSKDTDEKLGPQPAKSTNPTLKVLSKEPKPHIIGGKQMSEGIAVKRSVPGTTSVSSPKRKTNDLPPTVTAPGQSKTVSPLKLQVPKQESQFSMPKSSDVPKPPLKKMPDLKPTIPSSQVTQNKASPVNKVRMDLLANNSDPTIDRSKILSQVKSSLGVHNPGQTSGDPLKSLLLDSCKINIPSSLSITLTDQKLDPRSPGDPPTNDPKKNVVTNKNLTAASGVIPHKVPSPPVHNYIEILKLPDSNPKKQQNKTDANIETKPNQQGKSDISTALGQVKPPGKSSESSAKGPVPNLKPIADTKLGKQSGNFVSPITFQQTFEQQLQSLQSDKKTKLPKNKAQVPKLVPATPKSFNTVNKLNNPNNSTNKSPSTNVSTESKPNTALDLTTPHNIQSQIGQHQSRLLETMQSIANLAKKQTQPIKNLPANVTQGNVYSSNTNRPVIAGPSPLRIPTASGITQVKQDKAGATTSQASNVRQDMPNKSFQLNQSGGGNAIMSSASYQSPSHNSTSTAQPSPRSQTRSPSSSPKLIIAEEKQASGSSSEQNVNQSNQISSTQIPNLNTLKSDSQKSTPGPSKPGLKPMKPLTPGVKLSGIRQPITPTLKSNPTLNVPTDYITPQLMAQHALMPHLRHQIEIQNWYKAKHDLLKSMANAGYQNQHDFNNKDK